MPASEIELPRNLMAGWMGRIGFHLEPLADRVLHHIRSGERIFADETTLPTLVPGAGKAKIAWLWTYARDDRSFGSTGPPMVAYRFEDSRGGKCPAHHLAGFAGLLQIDGYGAYTAARRCPSRRRPGDARGLLGASEAVLLRAPCCRPVDHRHLDGRAHGRPMARRAGSPRQQTRDPPGGAACDIRRDRGRTVRALGDRAQAHPAQIQTGRSDPLRNTAPRRVRTLPSRRPARHRQQYRRARPSARKPSRARTRSSRDRTAADGPGRSSPRCSRPQSSTTSILTPGSNSPWSASPADGPTANSTPSCRGIIAQPERPRLAAYRDLACR